MNSRFHPLFVIIHNNRLGSCDFNSGFLIVARLVKINYYNFGPQVLYT